MSRPTPLFAQDKLTLLLSLVPYLIDHDGVTITEVAAHFGVSEEHVRKTVELIGVSGIPGETQTYQANDLFDIDWDFYETEGRISITQTVAIDDESRPRFSAREAAALMAGLQYLQSLPEHADHAALGSLMAKLQLGASGQPTAVAIEGGSTDAALALVRRAVRERTQLEFDYQGSRGERERRRIDPLRIESLDDSWYVRGWCHLREGVRLFRIDRMDEVTATGEPIAFTDKAELSDSLFAPSDDDLVVEVRVADAALPVVGEYLAASAPPVPDGAGFVRAGIRVAHFHGLKRLAAEASGLLTVLGPPEARQAVADWADEALSRYGATE